ncbi:circadian-associated transcriptional repressor-like isoform X2 [Mastacembelus armatus]|uniref:circadian-associated transcriptional repressor-like isoform X2 n=1 Tax=Mastacembelus armatus TaxID=205130 RepID=UPI000E454563|nr:circadian-associated transcriptional repressor-like isoform X2 [Mastacembelus armatus]
MSTSDSDYSVDLFASDEEDCDSPRRLSPQRVEELPGPPPSPSTISLRDSPPSCLCSRGSWRRSSGGGCATEQTPAVSPVQGFTSFGNEQTRPVESKRHSSRKRAHGPGLDRVCEKPPPDSGNELFSLKCVELQCYIQPLSSILRALRSGRYSERLSSFQESVAMDRIQRIMGVLQNPNMGGHFLNIIMKIEVMLQSWFPHIKSHRPQTDGSTPAKKQKHHCSASPPPSSPVSLCSSDIEPATSDSSTSLKWLHSSRVCSLKSPESTLSQAAASASHLLTRCSHEVTQDNAVSSSTDFCTGPPRPLSSAPHLSQRPLPFKISSPCLERLLQAKESIISLRTVRDGDWLSAEDS